MIQIRVQRLHSEDLPLPRYMTAGSAGVDLYAANMKPIALAPGERVLVPTGLAIALPLGYEAQIRPRSGLALRHGITLLNTPGTIDSDYRGEIQVIVINLGQGEYIMNRGERIAQMVINRIEQAELIEVEELSNTGRGSGGFGHTGK